MQPDKTQIDEAYLQKLADGDTSIAEHFIAHFVRPEHSRAIVSSPHSSGDLRSVRLFLTTVRALRRAAESLAEEQSKLDRYADLVDKKYETGLSEAEDEEMKALVVAIDGNFDDLYEPVLNDLRKRKEARAKETPQRPI